MVRAKYVYHEQCFFCRYLSPFVEQLDVYEDIAVKKILWNEDMDKELSLPYFIIDGFILRDQVVLSCLLARELYPQLFTFDSNTELLRFLLQNPKDIPLSFKS